MIILIAKVDEEFKNSKSSHQRKQQTIEENVGTKWLVQRRPTSCCCYINKKQLFCQEWDKNPRLTKIMIVIIPSQSTETRYEKTFLHD